MNEIRTGIKLIGDASGLNAEFAKSEKAAGALHDDLADLGKALDEFAIASRTAGKTTSEGMAQAAKATDATGQSLTAAAKASKSYSEEAGKAARASRESAAASDRNSSSIEQVGKRLKEVISVAAAWKVADMAVGAADSMSVLYSRLKLVTNGSDELAYAQTRLFVIAQQGRTDYAELGATYAQLARASGELGVSQTRLLNVAQSIAQAMAISGGSAESMKAALVQLSQGLASGTLRGEELNSVMEQTPRLAQAIAQGMGVSIGQLRALGQDGKLTALNVIEALEKAAPALRREFDQVTPTISQAFVTGKNSASLFIAELDRATGSSKALAGALTVVSEGITATAQSVRNHEREWSMVTGAVTGAATVGALAFSYTKLAAGVSSVGAALAANPVVAMLLAGGAAIGLASSAQSSFNATEASAQQRVDRLQERLAKIDAEIARGGYSGDVEAARAARIRTSRQLDLANRDLAGFTSQRDSARDNFRASERAYTGQEEHPNPFPGAKPLEEVRKYAKLAVDVQREAYDQSVEVAKTYENRLAAITDPQARLALTKERDARLLQIDKDAKREMQSIAEQGASEAKTLADAVFARQKAQAELSAAFERRSLDERTRSNEQFYKLGMLDVDAYYQRKSALEVQSIEISERLTQAELAQAQAAKAKATRLADQLTAQARVLGLERELAELATRKGAAQAEPGEQRALRLRAEEQAARDAAINDRQRSRDAGYDMARQMEEEVRRMGVDAIKDPYARSRAQLELELGERKKLIDQVLDPDARALAEERFNDLVVAKNAELAERLKPGYQAILEAWGDTTRLMRDTYNEGMEGMLRGGEEEFVRSGGNLLSTVRSIGKQIEQELLRLAYRKYIAGSVASAGSAIFDTLVNVIGAGTGVNAPDDGSFDVLESNRLQKRASGGAYGRGLVLRGEKGPELSWENSGGYVFNAQQTRDILAGAQGGGGVQVVLNVVNNSNAAVRTTGQRQRDDGSVEIDVLVDAVDDALGERIGSGVGSLHGALAGRFGLKAQVN